MAVKELDLTTYADDDLVALRTSIEKEALRRMKGAERNLDRLRAMVGLGAAPSGFGAGNGKAANGKASKGRGGKRTRATAEEVEARKAAVLKALKGTEKGKGMSAGDIAEKAGLTALANIGVVLSGMRDEDKSIKMEGAKSAARWYLA